MLKTKKRLALIVVATFLAFVTTLFGVLSSVGVFAFATAEDTASAKLSRNENLVVKYGLDDASTGEGAKLAAYKWDAATQSYVRNESADAIVQNHVNNANTGAVSSVDGVEGSSALSFTGKAHARANFNLPANATGMTVSMWVKNINYYWSSLVEFWDGSNGGRFGKGTMQGNGGRANEGDPWSANCPAHNSATSASGGGWDSFVINVNSGDNGGAAVDPMVADTWYQVTYVLTATEMKAYRDGVLKQTFDQGNSANILASILRAVKSGNGKLGIRLCHDSTGNDGDILDDFRIYNGAMSVEDVQALYAEYNGIKAIHGKTVQLDGVEGNYTADNGGNIRIESTAAEFPKILIGGVTADQVTGSGSTYSFTDSDGSKGFTYSYTVGEYVNIERRAVVTFSDTQSGTQMVFTVTQVNHDVKVIKLTSLKISVNGESRAVEGFEPDKTEYTIYLTPNDYNVSFEVEVDEGGTSNVGEVNAALNYNGENIITTSGEGAAGGIYKITLRRDRADTALPALGGVQLGYTAQNVYVDTLPSTLSESDVALVYAGAEVRNFNYSGGVLTFKVVDKALSTETAYTITYKTKQEGHIAQWSFEESADNKVFKGKKWDAAQSAYVEDSALNMTVRSTSNNEAVTDTRKSVAATKVTGVLGTGIELPAWGYTTASLPAVSTTGFTFSTWMKLDGIVWEAVFAVLGNEHGTILEKGHMQKHDIDASGQPVNGWNHLSNSTGVWLNGVGDDDAKKSFFNTPSNGASYVFYTVTVTYANGVGIVKFYKDGELAVVHENDEGSTDKAKILIEALKGGAKIGLHRHHLDGGNKSRFDETSVYAYAQTDEEIRAAYDSVADLLSASPEYYDVEGLGYPDLLLGGAESVSGSSVKSGVTAKGIQYSYAPVSYEKTTFANDEKGVEVTFNKDGMTRVATVKYRRTLKIEAESLGYKIGDDGDPVAIPVPANAGNDITVKVSASADFAQIKAGNNIVKKLAGDDSDENYHAVFAYNAETRTATVRCSYADYDFLATVYTVKFVAKSTATFTSMTVTGGASEVTLTEAELADRTANVTVGSLTSFSLTLTLTLADGATLKDGEGNTKTFTQANLMEGNKLAFVVINESGEEITYYLQLVAKANDATLSALSVGKYQLSPAFAAGTLAYTVTVVKGEGVSVYEALSYTANDANAKAVVSPYDITNKVITVTVTAEDGVTTKVYTITIVEKDTDATLAEITVGGTPLSDFDPAKSEYIYKYTGELPTVGASATSATASVKKSEVVEGKMTITVTAEDGVTTKVYTITFVLMSHDASLKLTLNGTQITFDGGQGAYSAPAGMQMNSIAVAAEVAEGASYAYEIEDNKIVVKVTAEDGTVATYTVTVTFRSSALPDETGGETEDNAPVSSGCNSTLSIAGIPMVILLLSFGLFFTLKKSGKHE